MAVFEDRFIKGSRFTTHFTLDDPSNQVVPKPGTDLVPGALALNLGNNLPADTTNATDALTAAGFNVMANQVDTTDPFCGNAIQQAVTVAVGQSIACDAAAQEAIACAIASNPDAVACLQAVLGGSTTSGKYYVATSGPAANLATCYLANNGVVTNITPGGLPGVGTASIRLLDVNKDNPVAYYWQSNPGWNLRQVTMSDTGVTVTDFDMSTTLSPPPGAVSSIGWLFDYGTYDPLTKALYVSVRVSGTLDDGNTAGAKAALVKLTLNAQGLVTGSSIALTLQDTNDPSVVSDAYFGGQAAQGKIPLYSGKIFNVVTGTVITGQPFNDYGIDRNMSPDGTKYVGRAGFPNQVVQVFDTATNTLVCTITPPSDASVASQASFTPVFSEDSSTVFVNWGRDNGSSDVQYSAGPKAYNSTTGVEKADKVFGWAVTTRKGYACAIWQPNASNGAMLLATGGSMQTQGIFELKNDAWYQVAHIPGSANYAGFYLVSA